MTDIEKAKATLKQAGFHVEGLRKVTDVTERYTTQSGKAITNETA